MKNSRLRSVFLDNYYLLKNKAYRTALMYNNHQLRGLRVKKSL